MSAGVSGATAVLFVAMLVCVGTVAPTVERAGERIVEARDRGADADLHRQNTDVRLANVSYDGAERTLAVAVENVGAATLRVDAVDLLLDGVYVPRTATVGGANRTVWTSGETLRLTASNVSRPDRIKVVTGPGVARVREV